MQENPTPTIDGEAVPFTEAQKAEAEQALQKMIFDVKRKLKGSSKNDLIRIASALLLDNYMLKQQLQVEP